MGDCDGGTPQTGENAIVYNHPKSKKKYILRIHDSGGVANAALTTEMRDHAPGKVVK
jgi:hypothetical protein